MRRLAKAPGRRGAVAAAFVIGQRNLVEVAELVVRSAAERKESRGLHYTIDYPERDDAHWLRDTVLAQSA